MRRSDAGIGIALTVDKSGTSDRHNEPKDNQAGSWLI